MPCAWAHLSCGQGGKVNVGPLLLDSLAMRSSHTGGVIERVLDLTLWAVGR